MYFPEETYEKPLYDGDLPHHHHEKPHHKCPDFYRQQILTNAMRLAWEQHVYWTRMFLISTAERLADAGATTARLMQNPQDIANVFATYYPSDVTKKIAKLLTEHLQIGGDLIVALRDGKQAQAKELTTKWYANADEMSAAFAAINPNYKYEELRKMFYRHLELTTAEVSARLAKKYAEDIAAFGKVEREAMQMADYFTQGIFKEFMNRFV